MKSLSLLLVLTLLVLSVKAQKITAIDSTGAIIKEWLDVITNESYINDVCIRGISRAEYASNLKLINQSLENYQKGNYLYAFEDASDVRKIDKMPEVKRIKLFLQTMSEIKLHKHFKARKWYYVAKNTTSVTSFARLQKNVENMKLRYKIDNYKKIRKARITALFIGGGVLAVASQVAGE